MANITLLLNAVEQGDPRAAGELLPLVYEELRRLAAHKLARETPGQTLQPTALVHEAYLRLVGTDAAADWNHRGHFFAAAAEAMRRILVENARRKKRLKHGGRRGRLELNDQTSALPPISDDLLDLNDALTRLAAEDAAAANVVQLHFFGGLTLEQVAATLGISRATVYRQWAYARAWLHCALGDGMDS